MSEQPASLLDISDIAHQLSKPLFDGSGTSSCSLGAPSPDTLLNLMARLKGVFFPDIFLQGRNSQESRFYHISANLDSIRQILIRQITCGFCISSSTDIMDSPETSTHARELTDAFMRRLPEIHLLLEEDAQAAYEGDPAASSPLETLLCYPSMRVMCHHRVAHELYRLGVPLIPRIISEMAHSETGIDIHPGATIGPRFFIDHGTGVVIGETCIIGSHCRLYQGVTLGALSFPKQDDGSLVKGLARHPVLEDNVVIYAGATILGRVTIGKGSVIGGNIWLTQDVPPGSKIVQQHSQRAEAGDKLLG